MLLHPAPRHGTGGVRQRYSLGEIFNWKLSKLALPQISNRSDQVNTTIVLILTSVLIIYLQNVNYIISTLLNIFRKESQGIRIKSTKATKSNQPLNDQLVLNKSFHTPMVPTTVADSPSELCDPRLLLFQPPANSDDASWCFASECQHQVFAPGHDTGCLIGTPFQWLMIIPT